MNPEPRYLVQTQDKELHGYWSRDILLCDLAAHKGESFQLYRLMSGFRVRYVPISEQELREEAA